VTPNDTPDPADEKDQVDSDLPGALGALVSAVLGDTPPGGTPKASSDPAPEPEPEAEPDVEPERVPEPEPEPEPEQDAPPPARTSGELPQIGPLVPHVRDEPEASEAPAPDRSGGGAEDLDVVDVAPSLGGAPEAPSFAEVWAATEDLEADAPEAVDVGAEITEEPAPPGDAGSADETGEAADEAWLVEILGASSAGTVAPDDETSTDEVGTGVADTTDDSTVPAATDADDSTGQGDAADTAVADAAEAGGDAGEEVPAAEAWLADVLGEPATGAATEPSAQGDEAQDDDAPAEGQTLWHGRFAGGPAEELLAFTVSLPFDRRLAADDLAGSSAHVAGLARAGIISDAESIEIFMALDRVERELASDTFTFAPSDEDIHTAIERRVTELAGDAGAKLHTGRSRNDQVATALRLWCKRELAAIGERIKALQRVLLDRAKEAGGTYLPGYTHLQRAQPVLLAHHLLAHGWALARDVDRLDDCLERLDVSPLGAGALAGSSLPLDPAFTADQLGFARTFTNSLDAVSDRDFVAEALFVLSLLAIHLSRMGEEVILWTTDEFGFARLDDAYATGSSMLPQKKNADIAELARGKAGRVIGDLTGLLITLKGLPLAYNRDLQEDKEPLFDAVDQVSLALGAMAGLYRTLVFDERRMQAAADTPFVAATDLAEWLVEQGMPFRSAHAVVGQLVRNSLEGAGPLVDLVALHPDLGPAAAGLVEPGVPVNRRTTPGGAGPDAVAKQIEAFERHLDSGTPEEGGTP